MAAIAAASFYLPRFAIHAAEYRTSVRDFAAPGVTEKAVPGFDEDEATMAVEACGRALAVGPPTTIGFLSLASSANIDGETLSIALGLEDVVRKVAFGTEGAIQAFGAAVRFSDEKGASALFVVSDAPRADPSTPAEHRLGAAAVAFLLAAKTGASRAGGREPPEVGERWTERVGHTGAAAPFLAAIGALHRARRGSTVTIGGQSFELSAKPKGDLDIARALRDRIPVSYAQYLAMRHYRPPPPGTEFSQGAYVSLPAYLSEARARYRLIGERCPKCGRVHFPPRESCLSCGSRTWEDVPLKRTGSVYAYTVIGTGAAPSEFLDQQLAMGDYATAVVELDDGPRVTAMLADVDPNKVRIGMRVRMVFRRLYTQEGVPRYGFKFAPT